MLDFMRKQKESWLTRIIFTVIILTFIFFFGYSQLQKKQKTGNQGIVARVNGEPIPYGMYKLALKNTSEFYKQMFQDKIPEGMADQIKSKALSQVVSQTLLRQLAKDFGISVSNQEIFDIISKDPGLQKDGVFDVIGYKQYFLPGFEREYGFNYETLIKEELTSRKVRDFLTGHISVSENEAKNQYNQERTTWSFERVRIPETPPEGIKYESTAEDLAKNTLEAWKKGGKGFSQMLKKYKLENAPLKDVNIDKKLALLPENGDNDTYSKIFTISKEKPFIDGPVKSGSFWYIFKYVDFKKPDEKEWEKTKAQYISNLTLRKKEEYLSDWLDQIKVKSKVEQYILTTGN